MLHCNLKQYHRRTLTCFINLMCILTILCLISRRIIVKEFYGIHVLYLVHYIYAITLHMFSASICHCWVCGPVTARIILLLNMTVHMVSSGHKLSCLVCECITLLCCCDNHGLWIYCMCLYHVVGMCMSCFPNLLMCLLVMKCIIYESYLDSPITCWLNAHNKMLYLTVNIVIPSFMRYNFV